MQIVQTWPQSNVSITLDKSQAEFPAHYFDVETGCFGSGDSLNSVLFTLGRSGPELYNNNALYSCSCNGVNVPPRSRIALQYNMAIQIGHYLFRTEASTREELQMELISHPLTPALTAEYPELDSLLGEQSYYSGAQDEMDVLAQEGVSDSELRRLRYEYKEYLQWGEQKKGFRAPQQGGTLRISAQDTYLETVVNEVKSRTVTECILGQTSMIELVLGETGYEEPLNDSEEADNRDLLYLLAPDHISKREKKVLSQITYNELHIPGLNTYL